MYTGDKWVREPDQGAGVSRVVSAFSEDGNRVLKITLESFFPDGDAALIAAAPDMLAALKDVQDFLKRSGYDTRLVREVIAKAEGRT